MKTNFWLVMGLMVAASAVAQNDTNTPAPSAPAPIIMPAVSDSSAATNAPAKIKKKKAGAKHRKVVVAPSVPLYEPAVTLLPGAAEVAADNVNVRGQAGLKGEFITHLSKGDAVMVLTQINLDTHAVDEPSQWAKIAFPTNAHVWVSSQFIDATNKTVLAKKLNLRAGPGENYSVLGVVERGTPVDTVTVRGDWTEIQPPATAYAFIAAMYLKQEASGTMAANVPPSTETQPAPAPVPTPVAEAQPVVTQPVTPPTPPTPVPVPITDVTNPPTPPTPPVAPDTNTVAAAPVVTNAPAAPDTNTTAVADTNTAPVGPRVVTHEGVVRHVTSLIEPTDYELYDPSTGTEIDYLYTTNTNLDIHRYKGLRIIVTGDESLAARWPKTPVLTIESLQVVK